MTIVITISVFNANPNSIWNRLAATLGRTPTNAEAKAEVSRIIASASERN